MAGKNTVHNFSRVADIGLILPLPHKGAAVAPLCHNGIPAALLQRFRQRDLIFHPDLAVIHIGDPVSLRGALKHAFLVRLDLELVGITTRYVHGTPEARLPVHIEIVRKVHTVDQRKLYRSNCVGDSIYHLIPIADLQAAEASIRRQGCLDIERGADGLHIITDVMTFPVYVVIAVVDYSGVDDRHADSGDGAAHNLTTLEQPD